MKNILFSALLLFSTTSVMAQGKFTFEAYHHSEYKKLDPNKTSFWLLVQINGMHKNCNMFQDFKAAAASSCNLEEICETQKLRIAQEVFCLDKDEAKKKLEFLKIDDDLGLDSTRTPRTLRFVNGALIQKHPAPKSKEDFEDCKQGHVYLVLIKSNGNLTASYLVIGLTNKDEVLEAVRDNFNKTKSE